MNNNKKEEYAGVPNKRKSLEKKPVGYTIYGLFYKDGFATNAIAACAAESEEEAISMLEKAFFEKDMSFLRGPMKTIAEDTGYKTSKKGIIYAYDSMTRSVF